MTHASEHLTLCEIAKAFVAARQEARALEAFPGTVPSDLATAYQVQEAVLALQTRPVAGWKIAAIRPEFRDRYTADRLVGPVLAGTIQEVADGATIETGVYAGGFAAVEAEFAFRMARDLPLRDRPYDADEVADAVQSMHIAMEIASSPLAALSDLGPGAVIADHGNNAGLVIGPEVPDWRRRDPASMKIRTIIDGTVVGEGSAASVPGGPVAALLFLVNQLATRGRIVAAGGYVSTGATTGVHKVRIGMKALADFGELGAFTAATVPIKP
jgi:2-keto-4-pentenoate hydratase